MLCLVGQQEDFVLNSLLGTKPVQAHDNRSNVFIDQSAADHPCNYIDFPTVSIWGGYING